MESSHDSQSDGSIVALQEPAAELAGAHLGPMHGAGKPVKFARADGFQARLRERVEAYFRDTGLRPRDCPALYRKTAVVLTWLILAYVLLVFVASAWWQVVPLAVAMGLAIAAVGFNLQHDGGHRACSDRPWVNKLMALTMDMLGASSYIWHWKHGVIHHTYVNITGHDSDIDLGALARLTPHQRRLPWHQFQHWYLWPLYGFVLVKWQLYDDFRDMLSGHIGNARFPRPRGWDLVVFLGGKLCFLTLALGIPLLLHPVWAVLLVFAGVQSVAGVVLSVVFQLAHCVEEADFPLPEEGTGRMENNFALHQVETTVDFAPKSRLAAWLLGGLNFQIEHHLFPQICHIHYPAIAPLVAQTCQEYGVRYVVHETIRAGVRSHYRWLRQMGRV